MYHIGKFQKTQTAKIFLKYVTLCKYLKHTQFLSLSFDISFCNTRRHQSGRGPNLSGLHRGLPLCMRYFDELSGGMWR